MGNKEKMIEEFKSVLSDYIGKIVEIQYYDNVGKEVVQNVVISGFMSNTHLKVIEAFDNLLVSIFLSFPRIIQIYDIQNGKSILNPVFDENILLELKNKGR